MRGLTISLVLLIAFVMLATSRSLETKPLRSKKTASSTKPAKVSLIDFYQKSMPAVMGMLSFNDTLKLVQDTFLTEKKADSIWPQALEESKLWFGVDYKRGDLEAIEVGLKKLRIIIKTCVDENTGKELTRCLATLKDALIAASGGVDWLQEQDVPKKLNVYISFHLMQLASLQLLKIQQEKDSIEGINIDKSIRNSAKDFSKNLESAMTLACEQRVQHVTAIKVCKVVDVLWQEFQLNCEERVKKRSTDEDDESSSDDSDKPEATETDSATARTDFTKEEKGEVGMSNLGGSQNPFAESFRAKVKDTVTGQYLYNKRMSVSVNFNKAAVMEKLYQEGVKVRNKHTGMVGDACKKYWEERGKPIAEQVEKLVDFPKKKKASKKKGKKDKNDE